MESGAETHPSGAPGNRGNDSQVPRGRGRPGAAAPRREPRAGPAPKPLKLLRRLPGATGEFLRLWIGDGAAVRPFARVLQFFRLSSAERGLQQRLSSARSSELVEADRHGASARDRARSRGGLGHCGVFCGCSHPSRFQRWERAGKTDRPGGGVSLRGRERERIELHLGVNEEPAERLCVRLKRQLEMVPTAVRLVLMVGSRSFLQCVKGKVPEDWRMADATAAFRKGVEDGVCNLEVGWPHVCSWGGDATACCRCHCHVTGGEGICKEQSRWMDRGEVMPDQKQGEGCREDWLEQVCSFPSGGMKEVVDGGLCAGSGWRQDPGGVSGAPLWSKGGRCVAGPVPEEWS
ncbi:uncharacterized protein LOC107050073 [Gallus gallus]|uniref:uncharacterized protein LOC107050073 n=1 Tax=Gallus gallus TaxID=9031 RepID=UPI001F01EB58|nr:uncharacterized protein LOC107050073 [Gallus gallus]